MVMMSVTSSYSSEALATVVRVSELFYDRFQIWLENLLTNWQKIMSYLILLTEFQNIKKKLLQSISLW